MPEPLLSRARAIIDRQVAHLARLVDDLLDVSRVSRGRLILQRAPTQLDDILNLAVETAQPLIVDRAHRLVEHRAPHAIWIDADLTRLAQVFANLLNNAAKFTPAGGEISVSVSQGDEYVEVQVSDTGVGIAADQITTVFELFAQGATAGAASAGGLGIGLTLAQRLVELHSGKLTVASAGVGRGATFSVRLPVIDPSLLRTDTPTSPEAAAPMSIRRVLVVDDNTDAADTTAILLRTSGCDVRTAYSGEEAIREVEAFNPDLVLLDLGLPGLSGIDVCRRIRSLANGDSICLVAVTGWGHEESRRQTRRAGFDAHLVKPVAADVLLNVIRHAPRKEA